MGNEPVRIPSIRLPSWGSSLSRRLCAGLYLGLLAVGLVSPAQATNPSSNTVTGSPLNLIIPGEDTYDYWTLFDYNFRVLNSSYTSASSSITALFVTTAALRVELDTLPTTYVNVVGDTMTGALTMSGAASFIVSGTSVTAGRFFGALTGNVTGNADTSTALAATPTAASSGKLCRGILASGNCVEAHVDTSAADSSTNPVTSDALFDHSTLTGSSAHGAVSANTASQIVTRDGSGNFSAGTITAGLSGNATTSSALASDGTNCSAGQFPLGIDASGNAQSCTAASGIGNMLTSAPNQMASGSSIEFLEGSTMTYRPGAFWPLEILVSTGMHTVDRSSITLTLASYLAPTEVAASSISWRISLNCQLSSATFVGLSFNNDNTAVYQTNAFRITDAGGVGGEIVTGRYYDTTGLAVEAGKGYVADIKFVSTIGTATRQIIRSSSGSEANGENIATQVTAAATYVGSAVISTVQITGNSTNAGNVPDRACPMKCYVELWRTPRQF